MSVQIENSLDYLYTLTEPVTAPPLTISCWFKTYDIDHSGSVVAIDTPDTSGYNVLGAVQASGSVANDPIRALTYNGVSYGIAVTSSGYSRNTWTHACCVFTAINNRAAYIDGGSKGTNSDSRSATPSELIIHGQRRRNRLAEFSDFTAYTYIAEAAVWNTNLSDAQVAELAGGASPESVANENLVAYWPLTTTSTNTDSIGSNDLTEYDFGGGSLTYSADHPTISGVPVDISGIIAGVSSVSGTIGVFTEVSLSGTVAATSTVGGVLGTELILSPNWQTDTFKNIKRLVIAGNDSIWYEDI